MERPEGYDEWPDWAKDAFRHMEKLRIEPDVLITRALLLGMEVREWKPQSSMAYDPSSEVRIGNRHIRLVAGAVLAMSIEMAAYRWLEANYPEALEHPVAQAPAQHL